jgi:hypothetical protein
VRCWLRLRACQWDTYLYTEYDHWLGLWVQKGFLRCATCKHIKNRRTLGAIRTSTYV